MHDHEREAREMIEAAEQTGAADHEAHERDRAAEELTAAGRALREAYDQWRDEPAPHWRRAPIEGSRPPRPRRWLSWAPLAACLALALLTAFRARIDRSADGWSLSFGDPPSQAAIDQGQLRAYVDWAVRQSQAQTAAQMQTALRELREDRNANMDAAFARFSQSQGQIRAEELEQLMRDWRIQRADDLAFMDEKINILLKRQTENAVNLYSLANFVQRANDYRSNLEEN